MPNQAGFTPDPHEYFDLIGHQVWVRTPGQQAMTGMLVSVGSDRLVLQLPQGLTAVARIITTRIEDAG